MPIEIIRYSPSRSAIHNVLPSGLLNKAGTYLIYGTPFPRYLRFYLGGCPCKVRPTPLRGRTSAERLLGSKRCPILRPPRPESCTSGSAFQPNTPSSIEPHQRRWPIFPSRRTNFARFHLYRLSLPGTWPVLSLHARTRTTRCETHAPCGARLRQHHADRRWRFCPRSDPHFP